MKTPRYPLHALVLTLMAFLAQPAFGFKLAPMSVEFEPRGANATQTFHLDNDSDEPVAIQITMLSRTIKEDGVEVTADAENDFSVYPPQFVVRPRQTQIVRVKWLGDAAPKQELAYRMVAEQLPVNLSKEKQEGNRINLLLRYIASIYIVPRNAEPKITLGSITPTALTNGELGLALVFENAGTKHAVLRNFSMNLSAGAHRIDVPAEALQGVTGENILAGHRRRFVIRRPVELAPGPLTGEFTYTPRQ